MRSSILTPRPRAIAVAIIATLALAACGGGGDDDSSPASTPDASGASSEDQATPGESPFTAVITCLQGEGLDVAEPDLSGGGGPPGGGSLPPDFSVPEGALPGGSIPDGAFPEAPRRKAGPPAARCPRVASPTDRAPTAARPPAVDFRAATTRPSSPTPSVSTRTTPPSSPRSRPAARKLAADRMMPDLPPPPRGGVRKTSRGQRAERGRHAHPRSAIPGRQALSSSTSPRSGTSSATNRSTAARTLESRPSSTRQRWSTCGPIRASRCEMRGWPKPTGVRGSVGPQRGRARARTYTLEVSRVRSHRLRTCLAGTLDEPFPVSRSRAAHQVL